MTEIEGKSQERDGKESRGEREREREKERQENREEKMLKTNELE